MAILTAKQAREDNANNPPSKVGFFMPKFQRKTKVNQPYQKQKSCKKIPPKMARNKEKWGVGVIIGKCGGKVEQNNAEINISGK